MKTIILLLVFSITVSMVFGISDICQQPPGDPGPCRASSIRYTYLLHEHRCVKFTYGGCLGNENKFFTKEECERTCWNPILPKNEEVTQAPESTEIPELSLNTDATPADIESTS
ncbi:U-actitoxin-Avd3p-like [Musca vetustissima]|uniref:U-actitoxin-Avd3p-like n=1 Tax=Musca vetustissima TaxID=27455 RepID=UPI002AB63F28|nr:U-actitoxin-Avd3p-like [Musca vetustissima]